MAARMLIDSTQPEENRVAVVDGKKLVSFDFESTARKQLKSNVYLAKITRVEPSLQAAFVDYGGNRHGFLAFSEIHPDYYRIPVEDREALLAEEADIAKQQEEEEEKAEAAAEARKGKKKTSEKEEESDSDEKETTASDTDAEADEENNEKSDNKKGKDKKGKATAEIIDVKKDNTTETVGGEQADDDDTNGDQENLARRLSKLRRRYKIQEVIKPRQILLIQVTKEERGNKGAALTTYISLPGRYCVLMPNSPRGGGVSRKIANPKDRKRLKEILKELNIPAGMSAILRTAGVSRNKTEIKRDLDYLLRLWNNIRKSTLESTAPALIYEEGDLCKRAVRDLYTPDVTEVLVAGEDGYRRVKDFMKMLVPSHAKKVVQYKDDKIPLFQRYQVEAEINDIFNPRANLPSGGYIIINPTEALVSIDVNSGRATRERNVDDMALKTNLEAAVEIARQLRLRDLGGLVVIDFIDMEHYRHNSKVERKLKEAMSNDRARIEIGRISGFGLLELSRQRLRPSLTETHFETCPSCQGTGIIRTVDSAALVVLRAIEEEGIRGRSSQITVTVPAKVGLYILNHKRDVLAQIEVNYGCQVFIRGDEDMEPHEMNLEFSRGNKRHPHQKKHNNKPSAQQPLSQRDDEGDDEQANTKKDEETKQSSSEGGDDERRGGRRRGQFRTRRGGRGRGRGRDRGDRKEDGEKGGESNNNAAPQKTPSDIVPANGDVKEAAKAETAPSDKPQKKPAAKKTRRPAAKKSVKIDIEEGKPADSPKAEAKKPAAKKTAKKAAKPKGTAKKTAKEPELVSAGGERPEYEKVNDAPENPKKGWWNKLVE